MNVQKNTSQKISGLIFLAGLILLIGLIGSSGSANAQAPGSSDWWGDQQDSGNQSCISSCGGNVTCELGCQAGVGVGTTVGGLFTDPLGTLGGIFGDGADSTVKTSFTEFQGGLTPPSTEGYSAGLVQQTSARDFILQVTNFALGFLGLIAVVIIIYGGFLYVTAAGNEDQSGKGKKAITYALVGIIIILASFPIVNTLLRAPSGTDQGAELQGSALQQYMMSLPPEEQAKARRQLFNLASEQVTNSARNLLTAYQNFAQTNSVLEIVKNLPEPGTSTDFNALMTSKKSMLESIGQHARQVGAVETATPKSLTTVNTYIQQSGAALSTAGGDETAWQEQYWKANKPTITTGMNALYTEIKKANEADFGLAIQDAWNTIKEVKSQIGTAATLPDIAASFDKVKSDLQSLLASGSLTELPFSIRNFVKIAFAQVAKSTVTSTDVTKALQSLGELYNKVKDILFVYAAIQADVTEGSAPLIVNFDALRSIDPLERTLTGFEWDFGDTSSTTNKASGPTATHTFDKPGTYVVKLTVKAPQAVQGEEQVADGYATLRITVRTPTNKIFLKSRVGDETFDLRKYDATTGNLLIDTNVLKLSPTEAAAGIEFDATDTGADKLQTVKWNFGDNTPEVVQSGVGIQLTQSHQYEAAGNYQMYLEVTDKQNNVDRKIVNIVVGSPIARVSAIPGNMGRVNQTFTFEGGSSTSDGGQISQYEWKALNPDATKVESDTNAETFKASFTRPGTNRISLTITDNLGETDTETIDVTVESAAPEAQYTFDIPDTTQPGAVHFDGSLSYDPDGTLDQPLSYAWEVNGQTTGDAFSFVDGTNPQSQKPHIRFTQKGSYTVRLIVTDPNGYGVNIEQPGAPFEKEIMIDKVLDIAWGGNDKTTAILQIDEAGQAKGAVTFTLTSGKAIAYEMDFGDGELENGEMAGTATITHNYQAAGNYAVKATVFDEEDDDNSIARKVFIGSSQIPVAVAGIQINGEEVFDTTGVITVGRTDVLTFDGSKSLNTDGTGRRLSYSWDFGDAQRSTQEKVNHTYRDIGNYEVSLKVTDTTDVKKTSPVDKLNIEVVGRPPILRSITAIPTGESLVTPVTVTLNAIGATDPDGKVVRYRWWYFDPNNDTDELGVQVTDSPIATVTIGTRGEENQIKTYKFAVALTDDENNSISSRELLDDARTATLEVTNGPNKAPVASFGVDRTSIFVGDVVNFSSSSTDPDGQIVEYYWDFEGDGFANNTENLGPNPSHVFDKPAKDGVRVRLKVRDNNESEAVSDGVSIFVDSVAKAPVPAFTAQQQGTGKQMQFTDGTEADMASGVTITAWQWDFNVNIDGNGDGIKDNDIESTQQNPTFEYPDYGIYRVKLSVTDSAANVARVTNFVNVKAPSTAVDSTDTNKTTSLGANVLAASESDVLTVLVSVVGFAILLLTMRRLYKEK